MQMNWLNVLRVYRLHSSHWRSMSIVLTLLLPLMLIQFITWLTPTSEALLSISGFLPLHTLLETIAIVIAMLVFAIGWNSCSRSLSGNIVLLSCIFFAVGWLDFSHTVSYKGMPDFITPSSVEKGLDFWLAARFLASLALLAVAIRPWHPFVFTGTRYLLMGMGIVVVLFINWIVLLHPELTPHTFIEGQGLTPYKKNLEYLFITLNIITAWLLWRRMRKPQPFNVALLFGAVCVMAMSELFFTMYATTTDIFNVLGHTYKVIAYLLIYRAIVVESIEIPYHRLDEARQSLALAVQASNTGLWDWDIRNDRVNFSVEWKAQLGYHPTELAHHITTWESLLYPEDKARALSQVQSFMASPKKDYEEEFRMCHRDGSYRWILSRGQKQYDAKGNVIRLVGTHVDMTERKRSEAELRIAAVAFESHESMLITNADGMILKVNQAFIDETGYTEKDVIGKRPSLLRSGRHNEDFYRNMWETIQHTGSWQGEVWDRRKNGDVYPKWLTITAVKGKDGAVTHYVGSHIDISERKSAEEKIQHLAFYDALTSLPNRRLFQDRLSHALASSVRSGQLGALLFLDLDNFKILNDTLGHDVGDMLLQQVAQRLTSCIREGDTVARLGGDEFVVMLEGLSEQASESAAQAKYVGEKILFFLNHTYQLSTHKYHGTPSVGVTLFGEQTDSVDSLIKQADIAMYQAKKSGRNALCFFDAKMQEEINTRAALEDELRNALNNQEFHLYYQIQVDGNQRPLGAETLIRWMHPKHGLVPPAQFIPLAEEAGLILSIGQWVLETACAQLKAWERDEVTRNLVLAVNVSAVQFKQVDFVVQVQKVIQRHGINPMKLKLELTESMLVDNVENIIVTMQTLKDVGIQFSLDDFGTGYSSLQYIRQLPLDQLKIDQSFIRDMASDSGDHAIVRTIIAMANSLDIDVIAEGVETEEQQRLLHHLGCNHYQGYLFSKPVPIEQFEALLGKS